MKITFLGATHEVTGSCTYLEVGDKRGLVDYGMEQGKDIYVNEPLPVPPEAMDFVLLTHAHVDHSGLLPLLYKQGYRGPVYASAATCSLCDIMLRDCANIQMSEAEWKNRKNQRSGGPAVEPLYDLDDAAGLVSLLRPCGYGKEIQVNDCVTIRLTDVGHLLGSAAIEVWLTEDGETRKITFSGDLGNGGQAILRDPQFVKDTEYLVIESTYGDRLHSEERVDYVKELAKRIQTTMDRGGNVIIPSFAVGRTQEMLYFIREIKEKNLVTGHGDFPVYVDSPLAIEATSIFLQCDTEYVDDEMQRLIRSGINPIVFPGLELTVSQEESRAINENRTPKVIISASGMCDAGRIRHHLKHNLWREECMILFVGYQSAGTLGRLLVDGIDHVKLFDEDIEVKAQIDTLPGISGHADKAGLIRWLGGFEEKPKLVFVNHGDPDTADSFTTCLNTELGYRAYAPYSGCRFDLLAGQFEKMPDGKPIAKPGSGGKQRKVSAAYTRMVAAAERLLQIAKSIEGRANKELAGYADAITKLADKMEK
ncbi:MAG: MBL fold metallo-hydrolase [Oscillospiraceae bacterium]|nr:MBL fold metallo-hydrolase [Oscillospiraceae bacterium]